MKIRLREMGAGESDSEDDVSEDESAIVGDAVGGETTLRRLGFEETSESF